MGTKMKGIYKGFKYTLSQIFVVKERDEIEIGHPTDVKHVAHIGWDGSSRNAPSWMNEFRTGPNFASASIGRTGSSLSPWSPQDCVETKPQNSGSEIFDDVVASPQLPTAIKKKQKRRKPKSNSSPKSKSPTSVRSSRTPKPKTKFSEGDTTPAINIEVA